MSASAPAPDLCTADDIARAEHRRAVLERLTELGMCLAETIVSRAAEAPGDVEPQREPGRAFASVARAVRLTLALEARIDTDIIAMRNVKVVPAVGAPVPAPGPAAPNVGETPPSPRRAHIRGAVWEAINQEMRGLEEASSVLDRLHESLIEREDYEDLLERPWREAVAAICSDLGLDPDWSRWSEANGFVREPGASGYSWQNFWTYSPERSAERRMRRGGDPPATLMTPALQPSP